MPSPLAQTALALAIGFSSLATIPAWAQTASGSRAPTTTATTYALPAASNAQAPRTQAPPLAQPAEPARARKKKAKQPRPVRISIERGTLTVDGLTCKAALNYKIASVHYLYMYVPDAGTIIVSRSPFPEATEQRNAFHGQGLTVEAGGHVAELYSENTLLSKKHASAWVRLDRSAGLLSRYPMFGYGENTEAPYSWPSAMPAPPEEGVADAPPLPPSMLQTASPQAMPVSLSTSRQTAPARSATPSDGPQY
ncbi:MAG: hypothetical protein ACYCSN_11345 [Acidobacteriaceae bacterium]